MVTILRFNMVTFKPVCHGQHHRHLHSIDLNSIIKQHNNQKDNPPFTVKGMRKTLSMSPVTMSRHIKTLEDYGMVTCTGGNKRIGFEYQIVEWEDTYTKHEE